MKPLTHSKPFNWLPLEHEVLVVALDQVRVVDGRLSLDSIRQGYKYLRKTKASRRVVDSFTARVNSAQAARR
jgi:hypothetical protein